MIYDSKPPSIGLWKSDRGPYATGVSGGIRFVLWENDKRGNEKAPDFRLVLEARRKRDDAPRDTRDDYREKRATGPLAGIDDEIQF